MAAHRTASWQPISATWAQGQIGADGALTQHGFARRTDYIPVKPGDKIRNDGPATGRNNIFVTMYVHEYNGTTWIRRTYLQPNGASVCTIQSGSNQVRLTFAYGSSSGMTMTQADVEQYAKPMMLE